MNYKYLSIYNNNNYYKFKLLNKKCINSSLFIVYNVKTLKLKSNSIIIEIPLRYKNKLYQLTYDVEEFYNYIKDDKKYFQQIYDFEDCRIILRFNLKIQLEEISIEIYNNNYLFN
jgi:hypothetical protein